MKKFAFQFILFVGLVLNLSVTHAALQCANFFGLTNKGAHFFETSKSDKIAIKVEGNLQSEEVFVFLNGLDRDMSDWDKVLGLMKADNPDAMYVRLDLFGQGETASMNPKSKLPYTLQTEMLKEMFAKLGLAGKKVTFISHSYGGAIAAKFVQENPNAVAQNIMISPFVDFLETHHPSFSPVFSFAKTFSYAFGLKDAYEASIQLNSTLGTTLTWPAFQLLRQTPGKLSDVIELTNGVRDIGMNQAVSAAGATRTSLIYSGLDELIPTSAHLEVWENVPEQSRGSIIRIPATHESVTLQPQAVFEAISAAAIP